jgi:hypothetical protein
VKAAPVTPVTPASEQPVATNTGALAVVAVGEQLKAYIPAGMGDDGHYRIQVVDAASTLHGGSGYLATVDLGTADGDAEAMAATPGLVIAVSLGLPSVWLIDPATDTVIKHLQLPDGYGAWDVSNRNVFLSGVAIDPVRRRAYLSVWSGFIILDLDTQDFSGNIYMAPSEHFAFDPVHNRLVAPFYACPDPSIGTATPPPCGDYHSLDASGTLIAQGINVVDLETGHIFTYVNDAALDQSAPAGLFPDAAAIDPTGGLAIVPVEDPAEAMLLDLANATFVPPAGAGAGTFTASIIELGTPPEMTGVAIETVSRLGIGASEVDSNIAFYDLARTTASGSAITGGLPDLPWGAGPWIGHGDPHNVLAGLVDGKPVAWLLSHNNKWLARIDLEAVQQLALTTSTPGDLGADLALAVTYIFIDPAP